MAITEVAYSQKVDRLILPVSGAGSNIPPGTPMFRGTTAGTNAGVLIPITASSNTRCVGLLVAQHNFTNMGDATTATVVNWYPGYGGLVTSTAPAQEIQLLDVMTLVNMDYSLTTTGIAVTSGTTSLITIGSLQTTYPDDGGWAYFNAGTGLGQLGFIKRRTAGDASYTVDTVTTAADNTTKITHVLPLLIDLPIFVVNTTTQATILDSANTVGSGRAVNLRQLIQRGDKIDDLDPKTFSNMQSLNSQNRFALRAQLAFIDTVFHPLT